MRLRFFYPMQGNIGAKLICLLRGHEYGEPLPADPSWTLVAGCERCHAAAQVSMDETFIKDPRSALPIRVSEDVRKRVFPDVPR